MPTSTTLRGSLATRSDAAKDTPDPFTYTGRVGLSFIDTPFLTRVYTSQKSGVNRMNGRLSSEQQRDLKDLLDLRRKTMIQSGITFDNSRHRWKDWRTQCMAEMIEIKEICPDLTWDKIARMPGVLAWRPWTGIPTELHDLGIYLESLEGTARLERLIDADHSVQDSGNGDEATGVEASEEHAAKAVGP